jgi:hypothetical protein
MLRKLATTPMKGSSMFRTMMYRLAIVVVVVATGCGGSSSPGTTDSGVKIDAPKPHDSGTDVGVFDFGCGDVTPCTLAQVCCTNPGPPVAFTCVAPASCQQADQITCDGPDECGGATPVCCGVDIPNGTGSYPNCNPTSVGTSCTSVAACKTHLGQDCTETSKVVICHTSSDCTDSTNNQCCTFGSANASLTFCIDSLTASLGGATCN